MKIHGHRGYSTKYPENTMISYEKALLYGADGIEVDVRLSSDGVYVIMHDKTVDRTTNGTGTVSELTYDYLSSLDAGSWFDEKYAGEKIPTLEAILIRFKDEADFEFNLHMNIPMTQISGALDMVIEKGLENRVYIFASESSLLSYAKSYNNSFKCITGGMPILTTYERYLNEAVDYNLDFVSYNAYSNSEADLITMSSNIHSKGKKTFASYLHSNYETLVPIHLNAGTDVALVNDVGTVFGMINAKPTFLVHYKRIPYIKKDGQFIRMKQYESSEGYYKKMV